jgi:c-di-GMP-related signal transduction protein
MAFERGRFCELAAELLELNPREQYLIGMVSMFPPMLRIPMEELVRMLPLRAQPARRCWKREIRRVCC